MSEENQGNCDKDDAETSPNYNNEVLKVLKTQSNAMMAMNKRIEKLENIAAQQQEVINQLSESNEVKSGKE